MNYVITGGSGYLGAVLIKRLLDDGNKVIVMDVVNERSDIEFIKCDITDSKQVNDGIASLDKNKEYNIIHLAALFVKDMAKRKETSDEAYFKINRDGTRNIVEAILSNKTRISSFLFSSAFLCNFIDQMGHDAYTVSKHDAEQEVDKLRDICDNVCILRISRAVGVTDPDRKPVDIIGDFMSMIRDQDPVTIFGENVERDYIHVSDVANIMINHARDGRFNACSTKVMQIRKIAEMIYRTFLDAGVIKEKEIIYKECEDKLKKMNKEGDFADVLQYKTSEDAVGKSIDEYMRFFGARDEKS